MFHIKLQLQFQPFSVILQFQVESMMLALWKDIWRTVMLWYSAGYGCMTEKLCSKCKRYIYTCLYNILMSARVEIACRYSKSQPRLEGQRSTPLPDRQRRTRYRPVTVLQTTSQSRVFQLSYILSFYIFYILIYIYLLLLLLCTYIHLLLLLSSLCC